MFVKIVTVIAMVLFLQGSKNVCAQQFTDAENQEMAKPIALVEGLENSETVALEAFDPTISYYVQNLNLSPDQLDQAQRISEAEQLKKDDLLRQIEALRKEAYNLEAGSLIAFEAILTDAQKATFRELRAGTDSNVIESTDENIEEVLNK
ncbi:MAG: hypothetical protein IJ770_01290 [Alphaproteobacteria bacterium]|nr:hypothetical protein [Alphaproteobacteria bacterium]